MYRPSSNPKQAMFENKVDEMASQQKMIEQKKKEIERKLLAMERRDKEAEVRKMRKPEDGKPKPSFIGKMFGKKKSMKGQEASTSNAFHNDGSFMTHFKKINGQRDNKKCVDASPIIQRSTSSDITGRENICVPTPFQLVTSPPQSGGVESPLVGLAPKRSRFDCPPTTFDTSHPPPPPLHMEARARANALREASLGGTMSRFDIPLPQSINQADIPLPPSQIPSSIPLPRAGLDLNAIPVPPLEAPVNIPLPPLTFSVLPPIPAPPTYGTAPHGVSLAGIAKMEPVDKYEIRSGHIDYHGDYGGFDEYGSIKVEGGGLKTEKSLGDYRQMKREMKVEHPCMEHGTMEIKEDKYDPFSPTEGETHKQEDKSVNIKHEQSDAYDPMCPTGSRDSPEKPLAAPVKSVVTMSMKKTAVKRTVLKQSVFMSSELDVDPEVKSAINKFAKAVAEGGQVVENITKMNKKNEDNPKFAFLFDEDSQGYKYYQMRLKKCQKDVELAAAVSSSAAAKVAQPHVPTTISLPVQELARPRATSPKDKQGNLAGNEADTEGAENNEEPREKKRKRRSRWGDGPQNTGDSPVPGVPAPGVVIPSPSISAPGIVTLTHIGGKAIPLNVPMMPAVSPASVATATLARQLTGGQELTEEQMKQIKHQRELNTMYDMIIKKKKVPTATLR